MDGYAEGFYSWTLELGPGKEKTEVNLSKFIIQLGLVKIAVKNE
jgi:hypothetical protein